MGRDSDESAPPITLPASWTRSPEASMGHLPGNPAEEPDSARSGGHLPGKSPWADAGSTSPPPWQALGPSAGGRARAFPAGLCAGSAVRASGGRSWPSQSEAGAARTRFPRRPRNGWRHRASARPHNGWRLHASALRRHLPPLSKGRRNRQWRNAPCRNRLSDDWRDYGRDIRTCGRRGILHLQ